MTEDNAELRAIRARLAEEEEAYARVLAAVDALAARPPVDDKLAAVAGHMAQLNTLWKAPEAPSGGGLAGRHRRAVWGVLQPALERQEAFNSHLVQLLNVFVDETAALHRHMAQVVSTVVAYMQRVQPMVDARDRLASSLSTARSELILEAFDRRQEELSRRLDGLLALRHRLDTVSEQTKAVRDALAQSPVPPERAEAAARAMDGALYEAFENEFRGDPAEIRERLSFYVPHFGELGPVVDLGCGRGEFLDLLREAKIEALGVDANPRAIQACRARGLAASEGDLLGFLLGRDAESLGGVFAAQVAEHLPPPVLQAMLAQAHRALRPGGLLVLETVNTRSVIGLLEVFQRDLTHEKPLHAETLAFLVAAAGFSDVRVEYLRPVEPASRLQPVPVDGLPRAAAETLNENVARLNALLYGPQEFAVFARR